MSVSLTYLEARALSMLALACERAPAWTTLWAYWPTGIGTSTFGQHFCTTMIA